MAQHHRSSPRSPAGGGSAPLTHEHPNGVAVFLTDGQIKFGLPDGKSQDASVKAGQAMFAPAGKHLPENVGDKPFEVVLVELKTK